MAGWKDAHPFDQDPHCQDVKFLSISHASVTSSFSTLCLVGASVARSKLDALATGQSDAHRPIVRAGLRTQVVYVWGVNPASWDGFHCTAAMHAGVSSFVYKHVARTLERARRRWSLIKDGDAWTSAVEGLHAVMISTSCNNEQHARHLKSIAALLLGDSDNNLAYVAENMTWDRGVVSAPDTRWCDTTDLPDSVGRMAFVDGARVNRRVSTWCTSQCGVTVAAKKSVSTNPCDRFVVGLEANIKASRACDTLEQNGSYVTLLGGERTVFEMHAIEAMVDPKGKGNPTLEVCNPICESIAESILSSVTH